MASFLRPRGDKANTATWNAAGGHDDDDDEDVGLDARPSDKVWDGLRHGDLVYDPDAHRGSRTFVVSHANNDGEKRLLVTMDSAGYCAIPVEVTKEIEDPVDFYSKVTDEDLYQGVTMIFLDPERHEPILTQQSAGRPVHPSRCVWWATYDGYYTISMDAGGDRVDCLNENTPEEFWREAE